MLHFRLDEKNSENIETRSFIKKPEFVYGVSNGMWGIWKPWLEMRQEILRNIDQKLNSMMLLFIPNKPVQLAGPDLHKGPAVQLVTSVEKPIEVPWPVLPPYQSQFWVKPVLLDRYTTTIPTASVIYRPNIAGLSLASSNVVFNTPTLPNSLVSHPISVPISYNPIGSHEVRPLIYIDPKEKNVINNSETNFWKPPEIRPLKPQKEESLEKVDKTDSGLNVSPGSLGPAYIPIYLGLPSNGAPLSPNHGPILENYGGNTIVHVGLPDSNIQITKGNHSLAAGNQGSNKPNLSIGGLDNYPGVIILKPNCTLGSTDCVGGNNNNNVKNETYTGDNTNYYGGNSGYPSNQGGRPIDHGGNTHSQNEYIVPTIADIDYHGTGTNENGYNPLSYGNIVATSSSSSSSTGSGGMKEPEMTTKSDIENLSGLEILSTNNSNPRLPIILEYIRKNT